ncbi:hypothetical protein E1B28_007714 [Marasmius oreades]|uniref:FIST domain-containing protein n=1 Tax=Marasmius oreades TaxID=181124 RepID=A0A9P7UV88_9AGAR|nr:uncharacterized protein E1B28_007714 [Marasmius oreades]KAG7094096.1 hypothetical protein E1B28_007714 [Marasmius oreades]
MTTVFKTIISRSPSTILSQLAHLKNNFYRHSLFFTVSPPSSSDDISAIVDALNNLSEESVGCISSPAPSITCSLAFMNKSTSTLFRSTIPGRARIQVGRWHSYALKDEKHMDQFPAWGSNIDWGEIWNQNERFSGALPKELKSSTMNPNQILYLSDPSPEGLISSLCSTFPSSHQLGLLASSTPFITGRPVTLFHNGKVFETGAVGVAISSPNSQQTVDLHLPEDVKPLGEEMLVTRAEGNLITTLNNSNPTRLLLRAIETAGIDASSEGAILFKEQEEFYLGVPDSQIHTITSGDISRGTMALNTTRAPGVGSKVQFYHRSKSTSHREQPLRSSKQLSVSFRVAKPEPELEDHIKDPIILDNVFYTNSENGFVVARGFGEVPWTCTVPGCVASLRV